MTKYFIRVTPMGKPPPLAVRLAKALPFQRARVEMRDVRAAHDDLHTADGARARVAVVSGHTVRQGRRYDTYATAEGGVQGLQALSPRHWPPLGAFIKLPALRVVHDFRHDTLYPSSAYWTCCLREAFSSSRDWIRSRKKAISRFSSDKHRCLWVYAASLRS